jgi:hypothetical protein
MQCRRSSSPAASSSGSRCSTPTAPGARTGPPGEGCRAGAARPARGLVDSGTCHWHERRRSDPRMNRLVSAGRAVVQVGLGRTAHATAQATTRALGGPSAGRATFGETGVRPARCGRLTTWRGCCPGMGTNGHLPTNSPVLSHRALHRWPKNVAAPPRAGGLDVTLVEYPQSIMPSCESCDKKV